MDLFTSRQEHLFTYNSTVYRANGEPFASIRLPLLVSNNSYLTVHAHDGEYEIQHRCWSGKWRLVRAGTAQEMGSAEKPTSWRTKIWITTLAGGRGRLQSRRRGGRDMDCYDDEEEGVKAMTFDTRFFRFVADIESIGLGEGDLLAAFVWAMFVIMYRRRDFMWYIISAVGKLYYSFSFRHSIF